MARLNLTSSPRPQAGAPTSRTLASTGLPWARADEPLCGELGQAPGVPRTRSGPLGQGCLLVSGGCDCHSPVLPQKRSRGWSPGSVLSRLSLGRRLGRRSQQSLVASVPTGESVSAAVVMVTVVGQGMECVPATRAPSTVTPEPPSSRRADERPGGPPRAGAAPSPLGLSRRLRTTCLRAELISAGAAAPGLTPPHHLTICAGCP